MIARLLCCTEHDARYSDNFHEGGWARWVGGISRSEMAALYGVCCMVQRYLSRGGGPGATNSCCGEGPRWARKACKSIANLCRVLFVGSSRRCVLAVRYFRNAAAAVRVGSCDRALVRTPCHRAETKRSYAQGASLLTNININAPPPPPRQTSHCRPPAALGAVSAALFRR